MKIIFLVLIFGFGLSIAYGYNHTNCSDNLYKPLTKKSRGNSELLLTTSSTVAPTSTTQFISSTGSCSAIAENEIQKKQFIANNYEPLKIDIARGGGEFVFGYANLAGCGTDYRTKYSRQLQKNFINIYGEDLNNEIENVFMNIEKVINQNKSLKQRCSFLNRG